MNASKIIDGKENDIGPLTFSYDPQHHILFLEDTVKQTRWEFKIAGKEMQGTLHVKGNLYRIIELKKED